MSTMPSTGSSAIREADPSRRIVRRIFLALLLIMVVGALTAEIYRFARTAPYSGNWLGRGHIQGAHGSVAIEIYLSLDNHPFGIAGSGEVCGVPSSAGHGATTVVMYIFPVTVEGNVFDSPISFIMQSEGPEGSAILPPEFRVQSTLDQGHLILSSAPEQHLSLTMSHGTLGDFYFTCDGLQFSART